MQNQELIDLWERLDKTRALVLELLENASEEDFAFVPPGFNNPASVIARHLAGAENFWIGQVAGGHDVHRDRNSEFSKPGWSRAWVLEALSKSRDLSERVFKEMDPAKLDEEVSATLAFKPPHAPEHLTRRWAILHALEHEAYHLGQLSILLRATRETAAPL